MEKKASSAGWLALTAAALALAAVLAVCAVRVLRENTARYEDNVVVGSPKDGQYSAEELQEMLDRSMLTMSMNTTPYMSLSAPEEGVNWDIRNPEEQATKLIRVDVTRNDTGALIYSTGSIAPGSYVTGTLPDVELEAGIYACTASFYSYDIETREYLGQAGAALTLTVLK